MIIFTTVAAERVPSMVVVNMGSLVTVWWVAKGGLALASKGVAGWWLASGRWKAVAGYRGCRWESHHELVVGEI